MTDDTKEIVERLRCVDYGPTGKKAADLIERQAKRIADLEAGLKEIAEADYGLEDSWGILLRHEERARFLLSQEGK